MQLVKWIRPTAYFNGIFRHYDDVELLLLLLTMMMMSTDYSDKKALLPQGDRAMSQETILPRFYNSAYSEPMTSHDVTRHWRTLLHMQQRADVMLGRHLEIVTS